MKNVFLCIFLAITLIVNGQAGTKKVVFVIADGIPADVLERVPTPNLDAISKKGRYYRASVGGEKGGYSQTPTISAVSYNSLLTGTWVNKHNVWDNDIKAPNYNYPTIFRLLKDQYPAKKIAIFSSWTDNRTKLIGEGLEATGRIRVDYVFDGYEKDTVRFPHDAERQFMHRIDEQVVNDAAATIRSKAPDLSWVYLEYTDDMGHLYGDSKRFYDAVQLLDKQMGRLWAAISYREKSFKEDWLLVITTDHGRDAETGKNHGGQSDRERTTWIVTNLSTQNAFAVYYKPAIVDILPTIARFMHIKLPKTVERELDGVSLTGKLSLVQPEIIFTGGYLAIAWKPLQENGMLKIWVTATNAVKEGGRDNFKLAGEVPLKIGHTLVDLRKEKSGFYKIVLEGPENTVNRWVVLKQEN